MVGGRLGLSQLHSVGTRVIKRFRIFQPLLRPFTLPVRAYWIEIALQAITLEILRLSSTVRPAAAHAYRQQSRNPKKCPSFYSPPRACALQVPGGRAFGYAKKLDRARRNLKPASRPISKCGRSRLNPFLDACHAIALQPNLQSEPRSCGSESNCAPSPSRATPPRLALTP